ncbi:MAG TPA: EAL domain-containing protein [Mycobacteriales bacterium]|nr:EAL domain-containing protein [Mycobacteriales bacterium]
MTNVSNEGAAAPGEPVLRLVGPDATAGPRPPARRWQQATDGDHHPALDQTLQLVADTIVESLGFEVAVVNLVDDVDQALVAIAVAGPVSVRDLLLGQRQTQASWERLLTVCDRWGRLYFLDHLTAPADPTDLLMWVPDIPISDDPEAWHPDDALLAPLQAADGRLVGILSVDVPRDGRRPDGATRRALEAFAVTASLAVQHATLHAESRRSEQHFRAVFDDSPVAIALLDSERVLCQVNDAYCALVGRSRDQVLGRNPMEFTHPDDVAASNRASSVARAQGRQAPIEKRYLRPDGTQVWGLLHLAYLGSGSGQAQVLGQVEDITARKAQESRLLHAAARDPLTGLANRVAVLNRVRAALTRTSGHGQLTVVLFCDLDRLKLVNDGHGHAVGDEYIRAVGQRLRASVRADDTVGRLAGDEFVIVLENVRSPDEAIGLAAQILGGVHRPLRLAGATFTPSLSIGVAFTHDGAMTAEELLSQADAAMYRAKSGGRGGWQVYEPGMRSTASAQLELRNDVPTALVEGQFVLHYQPVVRLADRMVLGHEALLRWNHPRLGLLAPAEFLDVILDTEYETPVTNWVLQQACRDAGRLGGPEGGPGAVAVNLSSQQLGRCDLPAVLRRTLAATGLAPGGLVLELTEDRLLSRAEGALEIARLREMGIRVAIDDFGTGYAGLGYLQRFPVDIVKLDRSFVGRVVADEVSRHICQSVIELTARCGLKLVAEGVETEEEAGVLQTLGAGYAQGFLFGRPELIAPTS